MKKLINQIVPIKFGMSLEKVTKIELIFKQGAKVWSCEYPGTYCSKSTKDENTINVEISKAVTKLFQAGEIELDTRITVSDTDHNPETAPAKLKMEGTLFTE